jgi:hypothetical protein
MDEQLADHALRPAQIFLVTIWTALFALLTIGAMIQ